MPSNEQSMWFIYHNNPISLKEYSVIGEYPKGGRTIQHVPESTPFNVCGSRLYASIEKALDQCLYRDLKITVHPQQERNPFEVGWLVTKKDKDPYVISPVYCKKTDGRSYYRKPGHRFAPWVPLSVETSVFSTLKNAQDSIKEKHLHKTLYRGFEGQLKDRFVLRTGSGNFVNIENKRITKVSREHAAVFDDFLIKRLELTHWYRVPCSYQPLSPEALEYAEELAIKAVGVERFEKSREKAQASLKELFQDLVKNQTTALSLYAALETQKVRLAPAKPLSLVALIAGHQFYGYFCNDEEKAEKDYREDFLTEPSGLFPFEEFVEQYPDCEKGLLRWFRRKLKQYLKGCELKESSE